MRKPAEVLELALTLLDSHSRSEFMCIHLDWMEELGHISTDEKHATRMVIMVAISPWSTLSGHLRSKGVMGTYQLAGTIGYRKLQVTFYTNLIATLKQE